MSFEEDNQVEEVRNSDSKKQEKALKKLDKDNHDIRKLGTFSILWHVVCRHKRVWFWVLFALGWVLFIKTWIGV